MKTKRKRNKRKGGSSTRSRSRSRERAENSLTFKLNVKRDSMGKITSINIQEERVRIILLVNRDIVPLRIELFSFYNYARKRHLARVVLLKMLQYLLDNGIDEDTTTYVNPVDSENNEHKLTRLQEEYIKMGFTNVVRRPFEHGCLEGTMKSNITALRENINTHYEIHLNAQESGD